MDDFISREAALACFSDWIDRFGHEHSVDEMIEYQRIEDLPAADVVEVVRCKECDSYNPSGCPDGYGTCLAPELYGVCVPEDFFCKFGRGKDSADK